MRKTLIALMLAAALPTVAMAAAPQGPGPDGGPEGHMMGGPGHWGEHGGMRGKGGPFGQLDLSPEQRQQIHKLIGGQLRARHELTRKYLDKLPAADQKAMQDEIAAAKQKTQADIRAVLKPEQQKKFDELAKKREERRAEWKQFQAWKAQQPQKAQ
ncbi:Spy/CpxP family protein refolding chaperone [Pseudomonas sp. SDO528_S397]